MQNRLAKEKSPYLLQHANNPVDWFPWSEEAFAKARKEEKPIFLSIGYSTCHWCHVMERESFESEEIAAILNKHFVSIKLDREERPDIDRVYMSFVQATTGAGGWPMSVWLTPDRKPFYGGTYFPPESRYGRPGFAEILHRIAQTWEKEMQKVLDSGDQIANSLREYATAQASQAEPADEETLRTAYRQFEANFDSQHGGFGGAPKFPRPSVFSFLLRYHVRHGKSSALEMTLQTLRAMAKGGIWDQLGGGFHRYSTDERWHVPHFEKMLYDQGQLLACYVEAWQISKEPLFAQTAREIGNYVLREMTHKEGGFFSAQDADSAEDASRPKEKTEGAFFVWTKAEIERVLGSEAAAIFCFRYGVSENGNALHDPHGEFRGKNILFQAQTVAACAAVHQVNVDEAEIVLAKSREKLFFERAKRPAPHLDDKILAAWNGLMISGLAKAGASLEEPRLIVAAQRAACFVLEKMREAKTGRLLRRWREGEAAIPAFHDDYAFLIQALLDLYEADFDTRWLEQARMLAKDSIRLFADPASGAFFETSGEDESVLLRSREAYDGAEPASNSVAILNLLRLAQLGEEKLWTETAQKALRFFAGSMQRMGHALPQMLVALDFSLAKPRQIAIAGKPGAPDTLALLRVVRESFLPNTVLLLADGSALQQQLAKSMPWIEGMKPVEGKAAAYVCENFTCQKPTSDGNELRHLLSQ